MSFEITPRGKTQLFLALKDEDQKDKLSGLFEPLKGKWKEEKNGTKGWIVHINKREQVDQILETQVAEIMKKSKKENDRKGKSLSENRTQPRLSSPPVSSRSDGEGTFITDEDEDDEEEMESSDDEELIQQVLAHTIKQGSSGKVINDEEIQLSEDEDVISLSRRMRHLYKEIGKLRKK